MAIVLIRQHSRRPKGSAAFFDCALLSAGGLMDLISTLQLMDSAVLIAMALLVGSFFMALINLVRQTQRG